MNPNIAPNTGAGNKEKNYFGRILAAGAFLVGGIVVGALIECKSHEDVNRVVVVENNYESKCPCHKCVPKKHTHVVQVETTTTLPYVPEVTTTTEVKPVSTTTTSTTTTLPVPYKPPVTTTTLPDLGSGYGYGN